MAAVKSVAVAVGCLDVDRGTTVVVCCTTVVVCCTTVVVCCTLLLE